MQEQKRNCWHFFLIVQETFAHFSTQNKELAPDSIPALSYLHHTGTIVSTRPGVQPETLPRTHGLEKMYPHYFLSLKEARSAHVLWNVEEVPESEVQAARTPVTAEEGDMLGSSMEVQLLVLFTNI